MSPWRITLNSLSSPVWQHLTEQENLTAAGVHGDEVLQISTTHPLPAVASLDIALRLRRARRRNVPATLGSMIDSCLEPDPADRPTLTVAAVLLHSSGKAGHHVA
jgi:hypothetical protein